MSHLLFRALTVIGVLVIVGCGDDDGPPENRPTFAAVAMPDSHSADTAIATLARGGNAVDAAVAAAFTLAVTFPEAGNLGGGGFMLVHLDESNTFLDYRERAPAAASRDMFLDEGGEPVGQQSLVGHLAAGVPGTVAGLWAAHERYGTLRWSSLLDDAIRLADEGFVVSPKLAAIIDSERDWFAGRTNFDRYFGDAAAGSILRQPELAATLRRIAADGPQGFYAGETAAMIEREMAANDGLITRDDLAAYQPVWREPLDAAWRDFQLLSAPPPSSGGFAVVQLLKMKDLLAEDFADVAHNSARYVHLVAEMEKRVFADRAEYFGDPDFVDVPIDKLISEDYIVARAAEVDASAISTYDAVAPGLESPDTTHFSIVDRDGNAVANTYTLNTSFGSGVVVEGAGFLLNNEMDDFSIKPDVPNFYGVIGGSANAIAPGKRMLSSMTPTMLLKDGEPALVIGTPGGSTIFTSVFQGIVNVVDFTMTPQEAAAASRFHHQLLPPNLITDSPSRPLPDDTRTALEALGYEIKPHPWEFGDLQIIQKTDDGYLAGSDPRGRGVSKVVSYPGVITDP
ncbi:MAG: gamma-glutamyltransferase [Pseudomonadota bacterium]